MKKADFTPQNVTDNPNINTIFTVWKLKQEVPERFMQW